MSAPPTAYPETARALRAQLREARLDHEAFETPLRRCELATCRATCCHDGAVLSTEEADTIRRLLKSDPSAFASASLASVPEPFVKHGGTIKTATRPASDRECAADFPAHFPRTRCVFLDPQHKCALQSLSAARGHHPWFYKPVSCWMHPVFLQPASSADDRPVLTLRLPTRDPDRFASCTPCGRPDPDGAPARETLAAELAALSAIADRNFNRELNAPALD